MDQERRPAIVRMLLRVHRRLLPDMARIGWTPYLWLFWLIGFYSEWFLVRTEPIEFAVALLTLPVFLALYFNGFWHVGRRVFLNIAGILLIGLAWVPFNQDAIAFFIYSATFVGRAVPTRRAYVWLAGIVLLIALEWLALGLSNDVLLLGGSLSALIGAANIHLAEAGRRDSELKLSQAEVRRLAAVAERERIARDLHDLLGHTLSLIAIKAELAAKLAARDDRRAKQEISEVESISRRALREVRQAVVGFRRADLNGELANARLACEAGGVGLAVDRAPFDLSADREVVLAMCLREAVTNVVRHASASRCLVRLGMEGWRIRLTVENDGRAGAIHEGAGLTGMRERVEQAGGEMKIETAHGVSLTVWIPVDSEQPKSTLAASREVAT